MSVNISYTNPHRQKPQPHPHQQLLRNILERLDYIQTHQLKSNIKTSLFRSNPDIPVKQIDKIQQNMKIIVASNIENLRRLQQNTKYNLQDMYEKINGLENRIARILKEKQQAMEYLQYRVISVENSQRSVTQFMKRVAQQENQKYSGVGLLQQRIKQIQHIFQLKIQKHTDNLKISQQKIKAQLKIQIKQLQNKIENNKKQNNTNSNSIAKKQQNETQQQILQLKNKIKIIETQLKEQKRKNIKIQEIVKLNQDNLQQISKKIESLQANIANRKQQIQKVEHNTNKKNNTTHKTYYNQNDSNDQAATYTRQSSQKKTQSSYLKPVPKNLQIQNKKNPHDILGVKSRRQTIQKDNQKQKAHYFDKNKNIQNLNHHDQDQNPFIGVRDLLKKSKQKQSHNTPKRQLSPKNNKKPLPRQNKLEQLGPPKNHLLNKNLPPVKAQPKINRRQPSHLNSEDEAQQQVFQVDQDGYLLDQDGNYIYDQNGERVQLSQEQMYDILQQQN